MSTILSSQKALRSTDFIQSIGVGTHLTATSSSYKDPTQLIKELAYLNVSHVRDRVIGDPFLTPFITLGKAGIRFDLIVQGNPFQAMTPLHEMAAYLDTVEGPNEVDRSPITYNGVRGPSAAVALQQDLYRLVHNDPILNGNGHSTKVLAFSVAPGANYALYGNISAYADYKNVHAYGQFGCPSYYYIPTGIARAVDTPNLPAIITETGNYTMPNFENGVNEHVQAELEMDTLLDDFFKNGVKTTYLYELVDFLNEPANTNSQDHWGLFHADGTPKISGTAIHNLTTVLSDTGAASRSFTPAPLTYSVTGLPSAGNEGVLAKTNGAYDIALWREPWIWDKSHNAEVFFTPATVTITLGKIYQTINVFDPLAGTGAVKTYHNVSSIQVALGNGALVVEVEPDSVASTGQYISTGTTGGVFTSAGADTVVAGSGAATVNASGAVTITGSTGLLAVNLTGSGGSVTGGAGALTVTDKGGNNTVAGGTGAFSYTDLAGNDAITTGSSASNRVVLGSGNDTVTALGAATVVGGSGSATVTLTGSGSSITGGTGALTVIDKGGNNTVAGGTGAFSYTDLAGDDAITTGSSPSNRVVLGSGNDTVTVLGAATVVGGAGAAKITLTGSGSSITGGTGALTVIDNGGGNTVVGGAGTLAAMALRGGDVITTNNTAGLSYLAFTTGTGKVTANGTTNIIANKADLTVTGNGDISVNGGTGSLTLSGTVGNEYIFTQAGTRNLLNLGSGLNTVLSHGDDTISASLATGADVTKINASGPVLVNGGAGVLSVSGRAGAVTVNGGTGSVRATAAGDFSYIRGGSLGGNVLNAAGGNSTLVGGAGNDTLTDTGSAGNNLLMAGSGAATLVGGSGNDTLVGGTGTNLFVLAKADAPHTDVIKGFTVGTDQVSFVGFDADPVASQQVVGGNLQLTLSDQTHVTFVGVTSLG